MASSTIKQLSHEPENNNMIAFSVQCVHCYIVNCWLHETNLSLDNSSHYFQHILFSFCTKVSVIVKQTQPSSFAQNCTTYHIALIFRGSLISRISRIGNRSRNYFNENFDTTLTSTRWRHRRWLYFSTSRRWMETIQGPSYLIHKECS